MDKPAEGLARIEWKPDGDGDIFFGGKKFGMEKSLSEEPDRKWAARLLKEINTAHASIVKPLREKAEALGKELKAEQRAIEYMEDGVHQVVKDRDAWKEKAEEQMALHEAIVLADKVLLGILHGKGASADSIDIGIKKLADDRDMWKADSEDCHAVNKLHIQERNDARADADRLVEALVYWLPGTGMFAENHLPAWKKAKEALAAHEALKGKT